MPSTPETNPPGSPGDTGRTTALTDLAERRPHIFDQILQRAEEEVLRRLTDEPEKVDNVQLYRLVLEGTKIKVDAFKNQPQAPPPGPSQEQFGAYLEVAALPPWRRQQIIEGQAREENHNGVPGETPQT